MEQANYWSDVYTVRSYETEPEGRTAVQTLCNYLQEAAVGHARILGFSVEHMQTKGLIWVLSRLHLKMQRYPRWRDTVRVATWPSGVRRLFACRDFELWDGQDRLLGCATSDWLLVDLATFKPVPVSSDIANTCATERGRVFEAPPIKLPDLERVEQERTFQARLSDLDFNHHVNNVNYIEWALEAAPEKIRRECQLAELQVVFRAASDYGDQIVSQSCLIEDGGRKSFLHRLRRAGEQKNLTEVKSIWTAAEAGI